MLHYNPQHVSSSTLLIFRRTNRIITASGIVTLCKRPYSMPVESWLNQLNAQFLYSITIYMVHYNPRHVSSSTMLIFRRTNCIIKASGIVTFCKRPYSMPVESGLQSPLNRHTVRPFTKSDDTRGCNNTICPPEDEQGTARHMLRIVMYHIYCYRIKELCINLVTWKKVYTMMHGQKNIKSETIYVPSWLVKYKLCRKRISNMYGRTQWGP